MTTIERSWIQKHLGMANDEKQWLARYAASHLVGYGDVIFVDSGTSLTALMIEIIKRQAEGEKLDLQVVTSNLQVIAMGRSMPPAAGSNEDDSGSVPSAASSKDDESGYLGPGFLEAFKATQIVLTGGHVNPSLDSLTGEHAVSGIKEPLFHPTTVFFGARGLSFRPELVITYQFLDEISAQTAYATRPTKRRVIVCDHTKLGITEGREAPLKIGSLLDHAGECIFLTSEPKQRSDSFKAEVRAFNELCQRLVSQKQYQDKELALWMITAAGEKRILGSLATYRQNKNGKRMRRSEAVLMPDSEEFPTRSSRDAEAPTEKPHLVS